MSNFVKKQYIYDLINNEGLKFVQIYASDGKTELYKSQDDELSPEQVHNDVEDFLENQLEPGVVYIKLSSCTNKMKAKGGDWTQREFRVRAGEKEKKVLSGIGSIPDETGSVRSLYEKNLALALQNKELENEIKRIKFEHEMNLKIDKLKEESPMDKYLGPIMGLLMNNSPQAAQMAAIHGTEESNSNTSAKERLQAAINKLRAVDKNYIETLELLAAYAEKNSQQYFGFIPMLKSMI